MDDFLTPVTTVKRPKERKPLIEETSQDAPAFRKSDLPKSWSLQGISDVLKSQPDLNIIVDVLKSLKPSPNTDTGGFNLVAPGPLSAQIANTLVTTTIPDFWRTIKQSKTQRNHLVESLRNANGIGAISSRLRALTSDSRGKQAVTDIEDTLDVLGNILSKDSTTVQILRDTKLSAPSSIQQRLMWKEYIAQVCSGRLIGLVGAAEDVLKAAETSINPSWLAIGNDYASWLGRNMALLLSDLTAKDATTDHVTEFYAKALGLGYTGKLTSLIYGVC